MVGGLNFFFKELLYTSKEYIQSWFGVIIIIIIILKIMIPLVKSLRLIIGNFKTSGSGGFYEK
jgi:hypothetical protein